jgi:type II secretory pathway pseudopilin PulG
MRRPLAWWPRDRRQAQAGATLIELLVSLVIMGLALVILVGTFSTGLLQASIAKRNTAAEGVIQYEVEQIEGAVFSDSAQSYSDCFATENATSAPVTLATFQGSCPNSSYALRADVTVGPGPYTDTQTWSITVITWPNAAQAGGPLQTMKDNR